MIPKPIAIITYRITDAIDYIRERYNIREINGAKRTLIDFSGQVYLIVTQIEHLKGYEISDFITTPFAHFNPNYDELVKFAATRIR